MVVIVHPMSCCRWLKGGAGTLMGGQRRRCAVQSVNWSQRRRCASHDHIIRWDVWGLHHKCGCNTDLPSHQQQASSAVWTLCVCFQLAVLYFLTSIHLQPSLPWPDVHLFPGWSLFKVFKNRGKGADWCLKRFLCVCVPVTAPLWSSLSMLPGWRKRELVRLFGQQGICFGTSEGCSHLQLRIQRHQQHLPPHAHCLTICANMCF